LRGIIMAIAMATSLQGYIFEKINYLSRVLLFVSAVLIMYSATWSDIAGIVMASIVLLIHFLRMKTIKRIKS